MCYNYGNVCLVSITLNYTNMEHNRVYIGIELDGSCSNDLLCCIVYLGLELSLNVPENYIDNKIKKEKRTNLSMESRMSCCTGIM